jgi:anti-anti-sigma factor
MAYPEIPVPLPVQTRTGYLIVPLPEEIDLFNAPAARDSLLTALTQEARWVIADMTWTRFCDAAGCRAVAHAGNRARQLGVRFQAVAPNPSVRKVFRLIGADELVEVCLSFGDTPLPALQTTSRR